MTINTYGHPHNTTGIAGTIPINQVIGTGGLYQSYTMPALTDITAIQLDAINNLYTTVTEQEYSKIPAPAYSRHQISVSSKVPGTIKGLLAFISSYKLKLYVYNGVLKLAHRDMSLLVSSEHPRFTVIGATAAENFLFNIYSALGLAAIQPSFDHGSILKKYANQTNYTYGSSNSSVTNYKYGNYTGGLTHTSNGQMTFSFIQ